MESSISQALAAQVHMIDTSHPQWRFGVAAIVAVANLFLVRLLSYCSVQVVTERVREGEQAKGRNEAHTHSL